MYTLKHKIAIILVALLNYKILSLKLGIRLLIHDNSKLILGRRRVKPTHRITTRHHVEWQLRNLESVTKVDMLETILDWESARFTKPDKPYNALDTLNLFYKNMPMYKDYKELINEYIK